MREPGLASKRHHLALVLAATSVAVLIPVAAVWALAAARVVDDPAALIGIGMIVSLVVRHLARLGWQRRPESREVRFSELMLWSWIRRRRIERRLDDALAQLGIDRKAIPTRSDPGVQIEVIKDLAAALEARDPYTHGHSRRVARYSTMIAERLDLPEDQVRKIRTAAVVHDVGKLAVPLEVLNKPGKLTDEEFEVIKTHAPRGAEMVSRLGDPELTDMVAHHHERLDGTGYPSRIGGEAIPLGARIIAVADTFDALTSTRPYRPAKRDKEALRILHAEAGTQLDPRAVRAFDRCYAGSLHGLMAWPLLASLPHRIWAPLESQAQAATGTLAAKVVTVVATTAATAVIPVTAIQSDPRDTGRMPADTGTPVAGMTVELGPDTATRGFGAAGPHRRDRGPGSDRDPGAGSGSGDREAGRELGEGAVPDRSGSADPRIPAPSPSSPPATPPPDSSNPGPVPPDIQGGIEDSVDETLAVASEETEGPLPNDAGEIADKLPAAVDQVKIPDPGVKIG